MTHTLSKSNVNGLQVKNKSESCKITKLTI